MTLEEALAKIAEQDTTIAGLTDEKSALLRKRDELLGKLAKFKKFESYADVDIEELIRIKQAHEAGDGDIKKQYESLYQQDKTKFEQRLAAIEKERETEKGEREKEKAQLVAERTKALAIAEFSKPDNHVLNPQQLWKLIGDEVRLNEAGQIMFGDEYKEVGVGDRLKQLREDAEWQNQFRATGATGSGSNPNTSGVTTTVNPFKRETWNMTEQARLYKTNKPLYDKLKAAAGA